MSKVQRLSSVQTGMLYRFLDSDKAETARNTSGALAAKASEVCGFPVTANQVQGLRNQMGLGPRRNGNNGGASKKTASRAELAILAREIMRLQHAFSLPVPDDLRALLDAPTMAD